VRDRIAKAPEGETYKPVRGSATTRRSRAGRGDDKLWVEVRTRTEPRAEGSGRTGDAQPSTGTGGASAPGGDDD
jgi:hypothetical protein